MVTVKRNSASTVVLPVFLSFIAAFFLAVSPCFGQDVPAPKRVALNPAFVEYIQAAKLGSVATFSDDGHPLGYHPSPVDLSHLKSAAVVFSGTTSTGSLPTSYDLRTQGRVTSVKDQGTCGDCWTFAAYSSLESWLKSRPTPQIWDFSEQDMNVYNGFDSAECDGGDQFMATAYLARWSGPVNESDVPYPYAAEAPGVAVKKHVQDVIYLPKRTGPTDNDAIKQAIVQYGAVFIGFEYEDDNYNSDNYAYWYDKTAAGNHAVAIVGWKDGFDRHKFNPIDKAYPAGDGAFIIKNSWGKSWGNKGYFYMSYYDKSLNSPTSFIDARPTTNYAMSYDYDPLGWTSSAGWGGETAWFANIFNTSTSGNLIKAVGFYTPQVNCPYEIYVYKNVQAGNPVNGKLVRKVKAVMPNAGYHTVTFTGTAVTAGKKFSVVVKLNTPGYDFPVAIEEPVSGYSSGAKAVAGQSFMSQDGSTWTDVTTWRGWGKTNVCLKAFAVKN